MDISVVVPLFNEEESLPELEAWIRKVMETNQYSYEIIMVDDGSKDTSWSIVEALSKKNPFVKGIKFQRNYGKSPALNTGFQSASGDVVITMDADLQDSPDEIPALHQMIKEEGFDMVSGWKKRRHDPISKTLPSKFFNYVMRKVSGIHLHDFNCGLKAYKLEVVKSIEVSGEMHRQIPILAKWAGFTNIGEKVVEHRARKYGSSKYGVSRLVTGFLDLLSLMFTGKFGKRPMHFFGTLGILSFAVGFVILIYLTFEKYFNQEYGMATRPLFFFGIVMLIIGMQLFVTGFLAELVIRNAPDRNNYLIAKRIGVGEHGGL
jgi:glycosyltransferase involved in cell wall biosynthesis